MALLGVLGTLAIARPPDRSRLELAIAHYGYPLWFVDAELTFPAPASGANPAVTLNPWEYPTRTDLGRLLGSWLIVVALPLTLVWWYEKRRGARGTSRRKSET